MFKNTKKPSTFINLAEEPIFFLTANFIILDFNVSAEKIFKIKKNSIIGKPFSVLCPDLDLKALEQSGSLISHIREKPLLWRSLFLKNSKNGDKFILIGSMNDQKNEYLLNKNTKREVNETIHEEITNLNQILTGQFIDKSKNTLEHVKNIYHYMENIIAEMPGSVYWMNKDCVYLGCNNNMANLFKLKSRNDIVGKTYTDLYDEKSASYYKKADIAVMNTGIPLSVEEPLYHSDGTKEIYLSKKVPLCDLEGKIVGMLGISIDITERKQMEEELNSAKLAAEGANLLKTNFIQNMQHDIRTPASSVWST
ncbi:MAG: PAS domain-containing protein, partial [Silvanigrellaceae bacterium]|nr:PAS domain-containing protein [Silvanigrellaceae bacterium]